MTTAPASVRPPQTIAAVRDCAQLGERVYLWLRRWLGPLVLLLTGLAGWIALFHPERLLSYGAVVVPLCITLHLWSRQRPGSLPILPAFLMMQALVFASPLLAPELKPDSTMQAITADHLQACSRDLLLWFIAVPIGWRIMPAQFSRFRPAPAFGDALDQIGGLPTLLVSASLAINLFVASPLFWQSLGIEAKSFLNPLRTLSSVMLLVGSFTGAYAWSRNRLSQSSLWLLAMALVAVQTLSTLLLSGIQLQALATMAGLWVAQSRRLLPFTLALLLTVSLLQAGKVDIRERYWDEGPFRSSQNLSSFTLIQQWVEASLNPTSRSQSLFGQRLNGISNLVFVEDALQRGRKPVDGRTYRIIPRTLVPRAIDPLKGRSHEGQVILNLHFGRQRTRLDTQRAYIAWGFLPEAIGNFGSFYGPILIGLLVGGLIRLSEGIGSGQMLLSSPGLVSVTLLFAWVTAYESVASTFVAAVFQNVIVVLLLSSWLLQRRRSA